jgi:hypothetical protein
VVLVEARLQLDHQTAAKHSKQDIDKPTHLLHLLRLLLLRRLAPRRRGHRRLRRPCRLPRNNFNPRLQPPQPLGGARPVCGCGGPQALLVTIGWWVGCSGLDCGLGNAFRWRGYCGIAAGG